MRISKSMLSKTCVIAGLLLVAQFSYATDIIIRKDDQSPPPQPMPNRSSVDSDIALTATVDNSNLAVYFSWAVGEATIIVYDKNLNVVYQTVADTDCILDLFIPSDYWSTGDYTITISYGTINLIGDFQL